MLNLYYSKAVADLLLRHGQTFLIFCMFEHQTEHFYTLHVHLHLGDYKLQAPMIARLIGVDRFEMDQFLW